MTRDDALANVRTAQLTAWARLNQTQWVPSVDSEVRAQEMVATLEALGLIRFDVPRSNLDIMREAQAADEITDAAYHVLEPIFFSKQDGGFANLSRAGVHDVICRLRKAGFTVSKA